MNKEKLAHFITLYTLGEPKQRVVDLTRVDALIQLALRDRDKFAVELLASGKEEQKATLACLDIGINQTSLKAVPSVAALQAILRNCGSFPTPKPALEGHHAALFSTRKGARTRPATVQQAADAKRIGSKVQGLELQFSATGSTDIQFSDVSAGTDGRFSYDGVEGFLYLRWGTGEGGSQGNRVETTIQTVRENRDKMWLVIHDGVELLAYWEKYLACLGSSNNVIIVPVRLVDAINWYGFVRRQGTFQEWIDDIALRVS